MTKKVKVDVTWSRTPDTWSHEYELLRTDKILLLSEDDKVLSYKEGNGDGSLIPIMDSNSKDGIEVSGSSANSTQPFWQAFDGDDSTPWRTSTTDKRGILQVTFPEAKNVVKYSLFRASGSPKTWTFEGSHDNENWIILHTVQGDNDTSGTDKYYTVNNKQSYKHYRINVTDTTGNIYVYIYSMQLFEPISSGGFISLPSYSEKNFINHGVSPQELAELDFSSDFTEKHYIQNQSRPLGSGKVFEQPLDHIIKKVKVN